MRSRLVNLLRIALFWFLVFASSQVGAFPPENLPRGQIVDKVACQADPRQTYALYLPSHYTPERKWPILYAFDAGARGRLPVERFKEAAERYGYILAGSNNSRNGPPEPVIAAIRALFEDTQTRFSINENRVYLAGFSGGARVAVSVAYSLKGLAAGVIGCGAGFPSEINPSPSLPFAYFGTVGFEDFNFSEMRKLDQTLDRLAVPHRIVMFKGSHDWPPPEVCGDAVEWMELQAMKSGKRTRDETLIDEVLKKAVQKAQSDNSSKNAYEAFLGYKALEADFKGLRDVTAFNSERSRLENSKEVRRSLRSEQEQEDRQNELGSKLYALKERYQSGGNSSSVRQELKNEIADLKRTAARKEDTPDRLVARRVLSLMTVQLNQEGMQFFQARNYSLAAFNFSLAAQISPENPRVLYHLACAYSQDGKKKDAIEALQNAVEKGFKDVLALETDPDLEPIRKEPAFQGLVEKLKKEG